MRDAVMSSRTLFLVVGQCGLGLDGSIQILVSYMDIDVATRFVNTSTVKGSHPQGICYIS
jgi:hypothetical protein